MTLKELLKVQKEFDSRHEGNFKWDSKITNENIEMLGFLVLALAGEVGETANIVKKIVRGDFSLEEKLDSLKDEIADIFIYLLKLSYQMDVDLEEIYFNKIKKNEEKFRDYKK